MIKVLSKATNIKITDSLEEEIQNKLSQIIDDFEDFIVENIIVSLDSNSSHKTPSHQAKIRVPVKGNDIFSESTTDDMYKSISEAVESAERQLYKLKGKLKPSHLKPTLEVEEEY